MTRFRLFLLLSIASYAPSASAYVDPGSGMLLVQGLITVIVAVIAFVKNPWKTLKAWVHRIRHKNDA